MERDEKLRRAIDYLTCSHLFCNGGYPYDFTTQDEIIHVASLDDGKDRQRTRIESYRADDLVAWYERAEAYMLDADNWDGDQVDTDWPDYMFWTSINDWSEAFNETRDELVDLSIE
jgi:hypothetical protein